MKRATTLPKPPKYSITDEEVFGVACIRIDEGPYSGVVFHYGPIRIEPDDGSNNIPMKFSFVLDSGDKALNDDDVFREAITAILFHIVENVALDNPPK
jgi:hypothetical protein